MEIYASQDDYLAIESFFKVRYTHQEYIYFRVENEYALRLGKRYLQIQSSVGTGSGQYQG